LIEPQPVISFVRFLAGCEPEITLLDEFDNLSAKRGVDIQKPGQHAVHEALAKTHEGPGSGSLQSFGPVAFEIAGPRTFTQQSARFQGCYDSAAQRLAGTGVSGSKVNDLQTIVLAVIRDDHIAIRRPDFLLGVLLGVGDFAMNLGLVRSVEV